MANIVTEQEIHNWPDLAISLYDKLTGRGSQIMYEFENLEVGVPAGTSPNSLQAKWKLNGTLRITTSNNRDLQQEV